MRLNTPRDLGLYIRDRRRALALTQAGLAASAAVSRRWLSELEAGKSTAEVGLVFRVLHALDVRLDAAPEERGPDDIDLDDLLRVPGPGRAKAAGGG
jgi:transcriptional regulator with XRE-family HTH domain